MYVVSVIFHFFVHDVLSDFDVVQGEIGKDILDAGAFVWEAAGLSIVA